MNFFFYLPTSASQNKAGHLSLKSAAAGLSLTTSCLRQEKVLAIFSWMTFVSFFFMSLRSSCLSTSKWTRRELDQTHIPPHHIQTQTNTQTSRPTPTPPLRPTPTGSDQHPHTQTNIPPDWLQFHHLDVEAGSSLQLSSVSCSSSQDASLPVISSSRSLCPALGEAHHLAFSVWTDSWPSCTWVAAATRTCQKTMSQAPLGRGNCMNLKTRGIGRVVEDFFSKFL